MRLLPSALTQWFGGRFPFRPTHVVPLGLSCRVAYQARTYFASVTAHPFDWWLTPLDGLANYLADPDPQRIFGEGCLAELTDGGHVTTIVAPEFGFQLFHEFPRRDVGLAARVVDPEWRAHVAEARERHARRLERLLALDRPKNRLLFVRDRADVQGGDEPTSAAADRALAALSEALSRHWSRAEVELLLVNVPTAARRWRGGFPPAVGLQQVSFEDVPGPPPETWRGDSRRWAEAFASAGYPRPSTPSNPPPAVGPPD